LAQAHGSRSSTHCTVVRAKHPSAMATVIPNGTDMEAGLSAGDAAEAADGRPARVLSICRRRKPAEEQASAAYDQWLAAGRKLPEEKQHVYAEMAWWSDATTTAGNRIFILAPRAVNNSDVDAYVNMWELLAYALHLMHPEVVEKDQRFAVVWGQFSDHRVWSWTAWRFQHILHKQYGANLEAVHVVHPSWTVRFLRLCLWPVASEEFWDYFHSHERIEFLDNHVDMRALDLPEDFYTFEEFLEYQANQASDPAVMLPTAMG